MIKKKSIIVELLGAPETGKTDFCSKIPNSAMVDLTLRFESDVIFAKNRNEKEFDELYHQAESFNSILHFIRDLPENITTISFDGSANLLELIEEQWCKDNDRKQALQLEYGKLYGMLNDKIILPIIKRPSNIVFTSGLKDEYLGSVDEKGKVVSVNTGKKVPQGIKPMAYIRDIGLNLYFDPETGMRRNKMLKNRFVSKFILVEDKQIENPLYIKELLPEATWKALIDAICVEGSAIKREWIV